MTIHLRQSRSEDRSTRAWGKNRLDLCLLVLKQLEDLYPSAALLHELFVGAQSDEGLQKIIKAQRDFGSAKTYMYEANIVDPFLMTATDDIWNDMDANFFNELIMEAPFDIGQAQSRLEMGFSVL